MRTYSAADMIRFLQFAQRSPAMPYDELLQAYNRAYPAIMPKDLQEKPLQEIPGITIPKR